MTGQVSISPDEMIGRTLLGRYRIVRRLAEGGMGVVYLARAEGAAGFLKPVVIKLILSNFAASPQFLGMFVREAQILAQLRHPGIVDVIEFGEQDGAYVMVLEYVAGYSLGQWARYANATRRGVPTEIAVQIAIGVLDALHHVHTQTLPDGTPLRITHRDVSPSNILLNTDGYAKLVDFGVARMDADTLFRTDGSGFRGKLPYSAPELFEGGEVSPQGDVYACSVVLHELLVGKNVFAGRTQADTMARVMHHVPESVHGVREDAPDDIDAILARGLAKSPRERYRSAAELAHALQATQRASEPELRARLASMLREDFGDDMAALLGIETLARRDRAWRSFSMVPPPPPPIGLPPGGAAGQPARASETLPSVHEQPTRVLDGPPSARPEQGSARAQEEPREAVTTPAPAETAASGVRSERASRVRWLPWSVGAVGLAAAALALVWSQRDRPPQQRIVLVESPLAREPSPQRAEVAASAVQPSAPEPAPVQAAPSPAPAVATAATPVRAAARAPAEPDPAALTRAFRRKQKSVEACFAAHDADLPRGLPVEIHFQVDARGRAQRASMLPAALDATPLGACLRKVALATRFPVLGEDVSFRIPVTARRVRVDQ